MKYHPHTINKITDALKDGQGRVRACKIANIAYDTFLEWMQLKPEFSELVKKAEDMGNDKIKDLQKRKIIEDKSWQSGAWWLERNFPEEFKNRSETLSKQEKPFEIVVSNTTKTAIEDLIAENES